LAEIEKRDEAALEKLAEEINEEHRSFRRAFKATFRSALRAGDLLNEAKEQAGHGNWGAWIEENCEFSERTARVYMRLANNRDKVEEMLKTAEPADLSIEGVLHELAMPASTSPVSTWESLADDPEREPAPPVALEDIPPAMADRTDYFERAYRGVEEKHGTEVAQQWLGEKVRAYEEFGDDGRRRGLYKRFTSKPRFVAFELYQVVLHTTARFEDIPQKNPLPGVLDDFEWRQVSAHIERWLDANAARWVEEYVESGKGRSIDDLRKELGYVLRHNEYADLGRIEEDAKILRDAGQNFAALANALEAGMQERTNE
jgi:hypothetical protein